MNKRKICIVTGTRAEYGLLFWLMKEIKKTDELILQIIVTGMHLSKEFGLTFQEIEKDFVIDKKIEILLSSDSSIAISKSMGLAQISFAEAYKELSPNLVILLGDRFEIFSAATAATVSRIPLAHIHGGETTEGAFDESFRHSITKMSHIHFTANNNYRNRVIQLGEDPKRVFNVGSLGVDSIRKIKLQSRKELEKSMNISLLKYNLLVTYHPVTLENNTSKIQIKNLLNALDKLKDTHLIFTKSNADNGGRAINQIIDEYVKKNPIKSSSFDSLGQLRYLSAMKYVDGVVGNSSSGLIEAPSFKIGTINIGDRQKGRIKANSVIDCKPSTESIQIALKKLFSKSFLDNLQNTNNPYYGTKVVEQIIKIIKSKSLDGILKKTFFDIK
jgi:GDP/UDP-N,N'-diacetylbacillosamine 2-epimerase (hydrolysing)